MLSLLATSEAEQDWNPSTRPGLECQPKPYPASGVVRQRFRYSTTRRIGWRTRGKWVALYSPPPSAYLRSLTGLNLQTPFIGVRQTFCATGRRPFSFRLLQRQQPNEWRTPNTAVFRIIQRGEVFYCYPEYCHAKPAPPRTAVTRVRFPYAPCLPADALRRAPRRFARGGRPPAPPRKVCCGWPYDAAPAAAASRSDRMRRVWVARRRP